jgi:NRAMP (natural resistance-associated macrophage protein)-like metal ion transporter
VVNGPAPPLIERGRTALKSLGPGLVTGAADDDPSGIATYSQAGAQFGPGLLWTTVLTTPLMVAIQLVSARIGWATGRGLAANLRLHYPRWLLYVVVALLLVANTINIGADLGAMAAAAQQLAGGGNFNFYLAGFAFVSLMLQMWLPFPRYAPILKLLTLSLLAYAGVLFVARIDWSRLATEALLPRIVPTRDYFFMVVAVFGTTISPYLFFWQASQEVDERRSRGDPPGPPADDASARRHLRRIKIDTNFGMIFSNSIAFLIMLATAVTLHQHGITDIQTTSQAAEALRPVAGEQAYLLFALGVIGAGMLAVPVLAGSAAYAAAEAFGWRGSLHDSPRTARGFYAILTVAFGCGVLLEFNDVDPLRELVWSAVVNGVVAVPIMAAMMLMVSRGDVMGRFVASGRLKRLGWLATGVMAAAVAAMLAGFV